MNNISIQLYSVRNALENDFSQTLKQLSEMGYDGVEFAGNYGGYSGKELNETLNFYGLTPVAAHINLQQLETNLDYHLEILKETSCRTIICSYIDKETIKDSENIAKRLVSIAEKLIMQGFDFSYHNHGHEFEKDENGEYYYVKAMDMCEPLVLAELDVGWLKVAGAEPEDVIRKFAGRVSHIHLKQFKKDENEESGFSGKALLENGIADMKACIKVGRLMGCEHFVVEQEVPVSDEMTDAKDNLDFLKKIK